MIIEIEVTAVEGGLWQGQLVENPAVITVAEDLPALLVALGDALREFRRAGVRA